MVQLLGERRPRVRQHGQDWRQGSGGGPAEGSDSTPPFGTATRWDDAADYFDGPVGIARWQRQTLYLLRQGRLEQAESGLGGQLPDAPMPPRPAKLQLECFETFPRLAEYCRSRLPAVEHAHFVQGHGSVYRRLLNFMYRDATQTLILFAISDTGVPSPAGTGSLKCAFVFGDPLPDSESPLPRLALLYGDWAGIDTDMAERRLHFLRHCLGPKSDHHAPAGQAMFLAMKDWLRRTGTRLSCTGGNCPSETACICQLHRR